MENFADIQSLFDYLVEQKEGYYGATLVGNQAYLNTRSRWDRFEIGEWLKDFMDRVREAGYVDANPEKRPVEVGLNLNDPSSKTPVRIRTILSRSVNGLNLVIRMLPKEIFPQEMIGFSDRLVERYCGFHEGLVLLAGATGSGKSTSMTFLNSQRMRRLPQKLVTAENPIEFVYGQYDNGSFAIQHEVGEYGDFGSFSEAVQYAKRQDPDMIMIQEIRTPEEAVALLTASLSGHLVVASIHAPDAITAIRQYIRWLEIYQGRQADTQALANALQMVIAQKMAETNQGFRPIHNIIISENENGIKPAIASGDYSALKMASETHGGRSCMTTFEQSWKILNNGSQYPFLLD